MYNGYVPNYPIIMSSLPDHGNLYASYNYQLPNENLVWSSPEAFSNQIVSSANLTPNSYFYQSSNLNSTNSDEHQTEQVVKSKRGRKKGIKSEQRKESKKRGAKRSESPASPTIMKKRRQAANARERRRMNGLNVAFDR